VVGIAVAVPAGAVAPATLALLLLLPVALGDVLAPLADAGALSVRTDAARARLDRLGALAPLVEDPADPLPLPGPPAPVVVDGVAAGWGSQPCLRDLGLVLRPGERVAVRGPSGSGTSTLAALLVRHLDPASGAVRVGGLDVRAATLDDVRARVGLATDDPHVFASSVCENVRLARPAATDEEVADARETLEALERAAADGVGAIAAGDRMLDEALAASASATSSAVGAKTSWAMAIWSGWIAHLPSKPSRLAWVAARR
jgi:ATP-binding cassette subfamily C protein CydCD